MSTDLLLPGERMEASRRVFLQMAGFGLASATMAGCSRGPQRMVIPYLTAPEGIISGRSYQVATSCHGCTAACGVLAKCRDGRPIKLEGNPEHALSRGGLCAVGQADILSLYDSKRISAPRKEGSEIGWKTLDGELRSLLAEISARGGRVRLLTGTVHSPSTRATIGRFLEGRGDARHVAYDPLSVSALLEAHGRTHGARALPSFRFNKAHTIVSFDADFLGTWISPVSFAADYAAGRRPDEGSMSYHVQLESRLSLSGSSADRRVPTTPWEITPRLAALCRELERRSGGSARIAAPTDELSGELAERLWGSRGHSLVVCGSNELDAQLLTAYANELLGNYGKTLSVGRPSLQRMGSDGDLLELKRELEAGSVELLIVSGVNPAFDLPADFAQAMGRAGTTVVHGLGEDESSAIAKYVLPALHALESWDDGEPELGRFTLTQPTVPALRDGRSLRRVLAAWSGDERDDRALLREHWERELHARIAAGSDFRAFFDRCLHDGYVESSAGASSREPSFRMGAVSSPAKAAEPAGMGLVLYPKVGLPDGRHAHNPWLQELPDPITKITWDNYASLSPAAAERLGLEQGDLVRVRSGERSIELPVVLQRGQHDAVVAVALGYGRAGTDRFSDVGPSWWEGHATVEAGQTVGVNAAPLLAFRDGSLRYSSAGVSVEKLGGRVQLAATQDHHSLEVPEQVAPPGGEVRDAVRTASLASFLHDPEHALSHGHHPEGGDLWPDDHAPTRHHWGMAVDLSSCTGCSACVIGCQAENNVPVVGRDEVGRHREMHWMRIDRYLAGEGEQVTASYQPMFCQQCDNAPCEAVCPVLATVHSSEGLNQQVYNRCVGTRYCANTCPYKVRRFNWFNYPHEDQLENHSLNPDVTVRSRGVMEKCTFCVQRIQEAKAEAARLGKPLADGDIQVACQQSCPTRAIVFGDLLDPESRVSQLTASQRAYGVLSELNVKPSVRYLARIRNTASEEEHHGV